MLQLTKWQKPGESHFHGQTRQLHGRMRHFGCWRRFRLRIRVFARGKTIVLLELAGEVAAAVITQAVSSLVHVAAAAKKFDGPLHSEAPEPAAELAE